MEGFKQGDIICTAKPFAYALSDSKRKLYCDYCLRGTEEPVFDRSNILAEATFRPKPKRCSQCQILYFCNQNCQQKAWVNFHKYECDRLKKCPLQTASLLIARIYIKLKQNLNGGRSVVDNIGGYNRTFDDLEQHRINIGKDVERSSMLLVAKSMLKNFCPDIFEETNKNDYNLIEEIYGKFTINSFEIVNYQFQSIGAGLYLGPSLLDHSCDPNAYVSFNGTACTIRAAREIPHRDMKNIFISYVDVALPKTIRQEKLEEQYYFTCNCDFCSHNTHEASKFEVLDPTKANLTNIISRSQNFMENHKVDMDPHGSDMIDKLTECNTILKLQEGILGEFHIYRMNLLDIALGYCLTLGLWDQALAIGLKLYDLNKLYYGETHCDHGDLSFKIAKLFLNKSDLDNGMLWLERARNVFETLLDEDHTLLGYLDQQIQRTQYEKHFANSIEGSKSNSTNKRLLCSP